MKDKAFDRMEVLISNYQFTSFEKYIPKKS